MKNIILAIALIFGGIGVANAQTTQTANEGSVNYTYLRQDVDFSVAPTLRVNADTDSHGASATYTRYIGGTLARPSGLGVTVEVAANGGMNEASLVTAMGGLKLQARGNERVQPYVRAMAGVGRQKVNRFNYRDNSDVSAVYDLGAGVALNLAKNGRYKWQFGADYINTGFGGNRQGGVRLLTGFVF